MKKWLKKMDFTVIDVPVIVATIVLVITVYRGSIQNTLCVGFLLISMNLLQISSQLSKKAKKSESKGNGIVYFDYRDLEITNKSEVDK